MNYEARRAIEQQSLDILDDVVKAGETLGFWKAEPREPNESADNYSRWRNVRDAEGLRFSIGAGSWSSGKVQASVSDYRVGPHRVAPHDVKRYAEASPSVQASPTRSAEVIAKDLHRRLIGTDEARDLARRVMMEAMRRSAARAELLAVAAKLQALGYETRIRSEDEHYKGTAHSMAGLPSLDFDYRGSVTPAHISVDVDRLPALLAALK